MDEKDAMDVKATEEDAQPEKASPEEKEYEEAWEEMDKDAQDGPAATDEKEGLPSHEDDEEAPQEGTEDKPSQSKEHGGEESVLKALKDTKAYATRLAQENSELQKKLKAFEEGKATHKEVEDARQAVKDAKDSLDEIKTRVYDDYPELKDLLDPLIEKNRTLEREVSELKTTKASEAEDEKKRKALEYFNASVKPEVLKVHADFDSVMKDEDYWTWAETQRPALRFAAMDSGDPKDISWALTEFKKFMASDTARDLKAREEQTKQERLTNAQTLRGGRTPFPTGRGKDHSDYDAGWDEAGQELAKEGAL